MRPKTLKPKTPPAALVATIEVAVVAPAPELDALADHWEPTGLCFGCHGELESLQPGGRNTRHTISQVPYGKCRQMLEQ